MNLRVVLVSPRNPLNVGAAARAMSNFGCLDLRLVNPYELAFREAKSAVNASVVMENAREYATVAEAVADCVLVVGTTSIGHRALQHPLRRLEYGARVMRTTMASAPVALLFGSEKFGLSNEDMSHCHWLMRIPTRAEHESMNLGQSVAVCLYELARNPSAAKPKPEVEAAARGEDMERITQLMTEILEHCEYIHERTGESMYLKLRRQLRRTHMTAQDANLWLGMLRKIKWKLLS